MNRPPSVLIVVRSRRVLRDYHNEDRAARVLVRDKSRNYDGALDLKNNLSLVVRPPSPRCSDAVRHSTCVR